MVVLVLFGVWWVWGELSVVAVVVALGSVSWASYSENGAKKN